MEISDKTIGKPLGNHWIYGDENGDLSSTNEDTINRKYPLVNVNKKLWKI